MKHVLSYSTFSILVCIVKHETETSSIPIPVNMHHNNHQHFRRNYLDWIHNEVRADSPIQSFEDLEKENRDIMGIGKSIPQTAYDGDPLKDLNDYDYEEDIITEGEFDSVARRKSSVHKKKKYEFTARVFNVNFSTSLDKAMEKNGKQIELSSKITIPNNSAASLQYKTNVKQSREQFYEMTLMHTLTQFRRVYFEFTPPILSHWENYEEQKYQKDRKVHTVSIKEYEIEATVTVPAHSCVEVSFLLDWIENFQTKFHSIMEINGVVLKSSLTGQLLQVPLSPAAIEKILKRKGINFIKPRSDEYISNGKSLYVRLSGDLMATFGATAYMSSIDIPCYKNNKNDTAGKTNA